MEETKQQKTVAPDELMVCSIADRDASLFGWQSLEHVAYRYAFVESTLLIQLHC
jgi:hypothetical protein